MTFVPDLESKDFAPALAFSVTGPNGELKRTMNIFHKLAHSQAAFDALASATRITLYDMKLDPVLRELAICTVTRLTGATYAYHHHISLTRNLGVDAGKLLAMPVYRDHPAFDDRERAVMRFAEELTTKVEASDAVKESLAAFLNVEERVELSWAIAFYNAVARVVSACDVKVEDVVPQDNTLAHYAKAS